MSFGSELEPCSSEFVFVHSFDSTKRQDLCASIMQDCVAATWQRDKLLALFASRHHPLVGGLKSVRLAGYGAPSRQDTASSAGSDEDVGGEALDLDELPDVEEVEA
eukprot:3009993-Amphidinium_carterae.1